MHLAIIWVTISSVLGIALAATTATGCSINSGQNGVCISTGSCKSGGGKSEAGHCPGAADIQCCTYGSCTASDVSGLCQPTSSCKSTSTPGLCPGPSDIQCCHGSGGSPCGTPTVNAATLTLIKEFEGFSPRPYKDPDGHPTIGVGHLCSSASCSEIPYSIPLSVADGEKLLQSDLKVARTCITKDIHTKLNANQYGALVSWAFNVGCGGAGGSTLIKRLNNGENANTVAIEELPKWNKGDGGILPGLTRRRKAEVELFKKSGSGAALPPSC